MNDNLKERERIIFLHDIPGGLDNENDIAKTISEQYPQLIVFSDPKPLSNAETYNEVINNNEIYNPTGQEFIAGANIYKNGIRYSLVRGICPGKNSIAINDKIIELQLDKYGFLRLISYPINSGYFYVGPYNPFEKGYLIQKLYNGEYLSEYEVAKDSNNDTYIPFYNSVRQILNEPFDTNDIQGFTKLMKIKDYDSESIENTNAYILTPKKWLNSILISNDLGSYEISNNLSNVMDLLADNINLDENNRLSIQDIIIDGVDYALLKTYSTCEAIRIYYKYDNNQI